MNGRARKPLQLVGLVGACAVCCPPLLLAPLGYLTGIGAGAASGAAAFGAPAWLVLVLVGGVLASVLLGAAGWLRRRRVLRRARVFLPRGGRTAVLVAPPTATPSVPCSDSGLSGPGRR